MAPLLHGGLAHLVANTVPLLVLGWLVLRPRTPWRSRRAGDADSRPPLAA